jgi:pyruvate formate lyase activating enzyme
MLLRAAEIGRASGLRYVYAGNRPGEVGRAEDTRCHACDETLIRRFGFHVQDYRLSADGTCPSCGTPVPGRWSAQFDGQITSHPNRPGAAARLRVWATR